MKRYIGGTKKPQGARPRCCANCDFFDGTEEGLICSYDNMNLTEMFGEDVDPNSIGLGCDSFKPS
jgi:hypothetical protein